MLTTRRRRHRTLHSASIPPILSYKQITFCSHDVASIHPHNCTVLHLLPHHQLLHCLYVLPPKISETSIFFIKKNEHEGASTWRPRPPCSKSDNKFETETTASTSISSIAPHQLLLQRPRDIFSMASMSSGMQAAHHYSH